MRTRFCMTLLCLISLELAAVQGQHKMVKVFQPGDIWPDTEGKHINAHGGGMLFQNETYYWYGEKRGDRTSSGGVSVYSSKDMYNWKNEGIALSLSDDPNSDITLGCIMERPKVIYNKKTKQYVMWFHLELKGKGYAAARAGVAVSDKPTGPFLFINSFRPNGNMSRDMNLYVDDDDSAYHIYSSDENMDLRIVKLTDDFLSATTDDTFMFRRQREAPALFKYKDKYYLITSGCTGWDPNEASIHVADKIRGPYTLLGDPMRGPNAKKTFGGQSTYVLPVQGKKDAFIFMADSWRPQNLQDSRYIWLPVRLDEEVPYVEWMDEWNMAFFH